MRTVHAPIALLVALAALLVAGCGDGGGEETTATATLDQATVTSNLEKAGYKVATAEPGQSALPGLVDVDFATGPDSGFQGAVQVSGNGLKPFKPNDVSQTGFVLFYVDAEAAAAADDSIGSGEGQRRQDTALFIFGSGLDAPSEAFERMFTAATGA